MQIASKGAHASHNASPQLPAKSHIRKRLHATTAKRPASSHQEGRKWTSDETWALLSWLFIGQGLLILVGTTTLASILLLVANGFQFQEWIADRVSLYFAKHSGLDVTFGGSIVPNWSTGRILFGNVSISTRRGPLAEGYSLYDITIDRAEITISLKRWLEGHGLVVCCDVSGVRGSVDKRSVRAESFIGWKYQSVPGDFELDNVSVKDLLITIINPGGFRPYELSIISAELPRFRKRFIMYDILSAESVVGILDGSLFSMHVPQVKDASESNSRVTAMRHLKMHSLNVDMISSQATGGGPLSWLCRGSVDIDIFLQLPSGPKHHCFSHSTLDSIVGKFGTVTENIIVDVLRESEIYYTAEEDLSKGTYREEDDSIFNEWLQDEILGLKSKYRNIKQSILRTVIDQVQSKLQIDFAEIDENASSDNSKAAIIHFLKAQPNTITFKVDFRFHNLRAHLPWRNDHGIFSTALIKPLLAYINEKRPYIPLSCHFDISTSNFDGAWTIYESGIAESVSVGVANSFERLITDRERKLQRLKKISIWGMYKIIQNVQSWVADTAYSQILLSKFLIVNQ